MHDQTMTVLDANNRLPLVRSIVRDAVELRADVTMRQDRLKDIQRRYPNFGNLSSAYAEEVLQMEESIENDEIRIDEFSAELEQIGAELIDAETGLVEFCSTLEDQQIRLSWKYDEPEVAYWRSGNETPAERKPLLLTSQQTG